VFDDRETVLFNPSLITAWDWRAALLHNLARPIVNISFAIDRITWGFSSFGFHGSNVGLHIIAVGLFYGWCTRALGDVVGPRSERGQTRGARPGSDRGQTRTGAASDSGLTPGVEWPAFFAAAVFALHPVMSSAVVYISARSELLCAIGFLTSLIFARRAIVASERTSGILAVASGALALGSSSSAAALPVVVLVYDLWVLRRPGWPVRLARIYAPFTLAVVSAAGWYWTGIESPAVPARGALANLLSEGVVVWRYLALLMFPSGQALVHDVDWATSLLHPPGLAAIVALATAFAIAVRQRRSYPLIAFGILWFIAVLAPTSSFVLARPLATRRVVRIAGTIVLALLTVVTYRRFEIWSDPMRLWEESIARSPGAWQAHWGYAEMLRETGQCSRAVPEYQFVLRAHPAHRGALDGLAACR
jgi:hypothetical protein